MTNIDVDVAIIGAGTAGMSAYRSAREHTDSVVLIEGDRYGTTCARVGCMPSKLLIAAADAAHEARHTDLFGIESGPIRVDGKAVMRRVRAERDRFVGFVIEAVEGWPEAHRLFGHARFLSDHRLVVGDDHVVNAKRIVIATGSSPVVPPAWQTLGERVIVNDDVFDWDDLPWSVVVFGGGVIGLELAQALHRLGVRVRLFGRGGGVGPITDPEVRAKAKAVFAAEYPFDPDANVTDVARDGDAVVVTFRGPDGNERVEHFDYLLAATGRRPNVAGLNLEATSLPLDAKGIPLFDRRTARVGNSHVFIAGDVNAEVPLLHEAADEGRIAGDNAGRFPDVRVRPRRTPLSVVFSEPQLAMAGHSFSELESSGADFAMGAVSFDDQGRARVIGRNAGLLRVYGDRTTGKLLGAEMVGPSAEHLGHLLAWSVEAERTVQQLIDSPFYHPVVEEGLRTALRDLNRNLAMGPVPVERCLDCGPGG
ncbi:MAG: dihydrolipoyl dehydrogenase [Pseudomonadota bacterium]